jgi:peptide/nickel transport system permease protein
MADASRVHPGLAGARGQRPARSRLARLDRGLLIASTLLGVLLLATLLAPVDAPHDPLAADVAHRLAGPTAAHPLGTDVDGRDVLSRLLWGGVSAFEGVGIALALAIAFGVPWGLVSGYRRGLVDEVLMRAADAVFSFPGVVLAVAITGVLGPSLEHSMASVGFVFSPSIARLLRASVLTLHQADFVLVARSLGVGPVRTALRHVLPNAMAPVLVQLCALASLGLLIESGLGFLGLGVQPPAPNWGGDLALAYQYFTAEPLLTVAPGLAVTAGALLLSQVGDGLRRALGTH